jgi:hypothetical protein
VDAFWKVPCVRAPAVEATLALCRNRLSQQQQEYLKKTSSSRAAAFGLKALARRRLTAGHPTPPDLSSAKKSSLKDIT